MSYDVESLFNTPNQKRVKKITVKMLEMFSIKSLEVTNTGLIIVLINKLQQQ